jgi:cation diffusion facilitator CzcD-associated flavoprotein CzcO
MAGENVRFTGSDTVKRVGVVGAGVSGVIAAAYLKRAGLDVTVFERSSVAGGVWYVYLGIHTNPY